jgi:hypothetical protein
MKNWEVLGEPGKAAAAKVWVLVSLVAVAGTPLLILFLPNTKSLDGLSRTVGFIMLVSWYFASARGQAQYVESHFGKNYPRRSWGKPLLLALLALVGVAATMGLAAATLIHRV